jgi:hypothetical protein
MAVSILVIGFCIFSCPIGLRTVVKFRPDSLVRPRRRAGVTHNVIAPRSFRSEVSWHGRSGPCCLFRSSAVEFAVVIEQAFCRPRRLGSYRLWRIRVGTLRTPRLLLFGLHRSLARLEQDERAYASAATQNVYLEFSPARTNVVPATLFRPDGPFERVTISNLGSCCFPRIQRFPTLKRERAARIRGQEPNARRTRHLRRCRRKY